VRTRLLVALALLFVGGFMVWFLLPGHWPRDRHHIVLYIASLVMVFNTAIIGLFALINLATLCRASLVARDPVPVAPAPGHRIAFVTTIVPDREPLEIVRRTLQAALAIEYQGSLDVWLLDEGDDPAVARMADELGVHYFTRHGIERFNQKSGPHKAKSKHGNYNAWLQCHGEQYQFMLSCDPDHVPMENFAQRMLGYFRDPNVAFVVGPQVYGNYKSFVTKAAESQQFLFHSLLQRAGNRSATPMLVGTNYAMRIAALRSVGGLADSITEDMATSLKIHCTRNPDTGERWSSVYTPDVIAVGEGPSTFTDYFSQQYRWSRGTDDVVLFHFLRMAPRLTPRQILHYALLMSYYPTVAISWILGIANGILYMTLDVGGVTVPLHLWLMLYVDAAALQVGLYFWNRRHNVSPHERRGSSGMAGMFISTLSVPIYVSSLLGTLLRRPSRFVVTSKGSSRGADTIHTFRGHLIWASVIASGLLAAMALGSYSDPWMYLWSASSLAVCLLPLAIWRIESRSTRPPSTRVVLVRDIAPETPGALAAGSEAA
jgi:cellulose synthase/poly-beta-1,6-N-acetylglucosamine synthase-like glycosyltransferase